MATFLVVSAGITTVENLRKKRAYVILAAFVMGMLLTPPDMISQTLLALPMWVLFELGSSCAASTSSRSGKPERRKARRTRRTERPPRPAPGPGPRSGSPSLGANPGRARGVSELRRWAAFPREIGYLIFASL